MGRESRTGDRDAFGTQEMPRTGSFGRRSSRPGRKGAEARESAATVDVVSAESEGHAAHHDAAQVMEASAA